MNIPELKIKEIRETLHQILLEGEKEDGVSLAQDVLNQGISPLEFFQQVVSPVVFDVGEEFVDIPGAQAIRK